MGRIIGYQYDDNVQDGDAWIGSEDGGGRTKQYTAEAVANYLNIQGKISIVGQMTYKYGVTPLSGPGTFAVFGGGTDPVAFSAITKLTLSNTDVSKQRVVEFLNLLVGSDILISKQGAISTFGYYSIDSYAVNATDPAYYDLGVTFKSGNGSMEAEQIYETQNFTLAAEENISTLQTTIDAGNTYASGTSLWQWDPGKISQVDPDEGWGLALSPEEGVIFTDGVGDVAGRSHLQATNLSIGNLTYTGSVFANNLTANRNFQLPNNSGTLALTTDITSSPWDTVTGGINYANGNVGIGATAPSAKLDVNGDALINGLTVGQGAGTSAFGNTVFGKTALGSITTGLRNVAIGSEALLDNTVGNYNIALGYRSLENNSANNNVAIGVEALQRVETASNNTAVGRYTLGLTSGAGNTAIGYAAGYLRVGGTNGNSIDSVFIGSLTKSNGLNSENEIVIGTGAESAGSNTVVLGNDDIVSTRLKGDVIVANGNVGIGTTSPSHKLTVNAANNTTAVGIDFPSAHFNFSANSTSGYTSNFRLDNVGMDIGHDSTARSLNLQTGNLDRVTILGNGNVGIGTTSPSEKLDVAGAASFAAASDGTNGLTFSRLSANNWRLNTSGVGEVYRISGNAVYYKQNLIVERGGLTVSPTLGSITPSTQTFKVRNQADTSDIFSVTDGGNVGIGTASPAYILDVASAGSATARLKSAGTGAISLRYENGGGFKSAAVVDNNGLYRLDATNISLNPTGNVGIGTTSPGQKLHVAGGIARFSNVASNYIEIDGSASGSNHGIISARLNQLQLKTNAGFGDPHISILPGTGGNVGIGTASPTSKLEVAGGDIELSDVAGGITMISPDGTRYRITVANGGTLTVTAV